MPASSKVFTLLFIIVTVTATKLSAQLWRYSSKYDPAKEAAFEKQLDKDAVKITKIDTFLSDVDMKVSYHVRTFALKSFEGKPVQVKIWERPFDGHTLHLATTSDKIKFSDVSGSVSLKKINENFLEVVYQPRGGSDQGFEKTLLLGVEKGKIKFFVDILSINEWAGPGEYSMHKLKLQYLGQNFDNYQIIAKYHDLLKVEKGSKRQGYDRSGKAVLKFDQENHVFFTRTQAVNADLNIWDNQANRINVQHINQSCPVIRFCDYEYWFINGIWYDKGKGVGDNKVVYSSEIEKSVK